MVETRTRNRPPTQNKNNTSKKKTPTKKKEVNQSVRCLQVMNACEKMVKIDRQLQQLQMRYVKMSENFNNMIIPNPKKKPRPAWMQYTVNKEFKRRANVLHSMSKLNADVKRLQAQYERAKKSCYSSNPKGNLCRFVTYNEIQRALSNERAAAEKKRLSGLRKVIKNKISKLANPNAAKMYTAELKRAKTNQLNWLNANVSTNLAFQKNNLR